MAWYRHGGTWEARRVSRGVPQGSPLSPWIFAVCLEHVLKPVIPAPAAQKDVLAGSAAGRICFHDDITLWGSCRGLAAQWPGMCSALAAAGLQLNASKTQLWQPGAAEQSAIEGLPVAAGSGNGITALGCSLSDDFCVNVGPGNSNGPIDKRLARARDLATQISNMAASRCDPSARHVCFVLLQRTVCPALDFDMRVAPSEVIRPAAANLHDIISSTLRAIGGKPLSLGQPGDLDMAFFRAEFGGMALRSPMRPGTLAAAAWAGLQSTLGPLSGILDLLGVRADLSPLEARRAEAASALLLHGVDMKTGMPELTPLASQVVSSCPPALETVMLELSGKLPAERGLQARICRLAEVGALAVKWPMLRETARHDLLSTAGPHTGILWADIPQVGGWLPDDSFVLEVSLRLGFFAVPAGARCQLQPQTGPHKGTPCGRLLTERGAHIGRCRAAEGQVRIHNSARAALATAMRKSGAQVDEELVVPQLCYRDKDGLHDAVLDIVSRRGDAVTPWWFDLVMVNSTAERNCQQPPDSSLQAAAARKFGKYGLHVVPLARTLRGRWLAQSLESLAAWAGELSWQSAASPGRLLRTWLLHVELAVVRASCESRLACLGGTVATHLLV